MIFTNDRKTKSPEIFIISFGIYDIEYSLEHYEKRIASKYSKRFLRYETIVDMMTLFKHLSKNFFF